MTMKDLTNILDWLTDVIIWTPDCGDGDDAEPEYEGAFLSMPWYFLDYTIGRLDTEVEEPIYIFEKDGKAYAVINCYDAEHEHNRAEKQIKEKEKEIEKLKKLL